MLEKRSLSALRKLGEGANFLAECSFTTHFLLEQYYYKTPLFWTRMQNSPPLHSAPTQPTKHAPINMLSKDRYDMTKATTNISVQTIDTRWRFIYQQGGNMSLMGLPTFTYSRTEERDQQESPDQNPPRPGLHSACPATRFSSPDPVVICCCWWKTLWRKAQVRHKPKQAEAREQNRKKKKGGRCNQKLGLERM